MQVEIVVKGIMIGMLVSIPLGPISILIIQRTVNHNICTGIFSATGAALSDTFYASVAGLGVSLILDFVQEHEMAFRIFATVILLALGISIFLSHPEKYAPKNGDNKSSYMKYLGITFLLTFSNPLVIFIHLAIFSGFDQTLSLDKPQMSMLIM